MHRLRWSPLLLALFLGAVSLLVLFAALLTIAPVTAQMPDEPPPEQAAVIDYLRNVSAPVAPAVTGPAPPPAARPPEVSVRRAPLAADRAATLVQPSSGTFSPAAASDGLVVVVSYADDWIEAQYEAGHTVWITLTDSLGSLKALASGETGPVSWWGGDSGFSTSYNVPWAGALLPDIQPGDWVYVTLDDGQSAAARIGTINGVLDVAGDTVAGTINAPWLDDPLDGFCAVWIENGPDTVPFTVAPDGGAYTCDFATVGWDIQPGHTIGVYYAQPDGHYVVNTFTQPVPRVAINKWAPGSNTPAEGGNFLFYLEYRNEWGGPAENVVITDTLEGFRYLSDTSGVAPTLIMTTTTGESVVWEVGTLGPYESVQFVLFVETTAVAGETVTNRAQISTSNPFNNSDPGQLESIWDGEVVENDTHLSAGKSAWTWDPAPGTEFVYTVNVCNGGSTGSTEVTLTDTLPGATTLVTWWAQEPGWQEVTSSAHQLVLSRPSFAAWSCSEIYLRVHLDAGAAPGLWLENTALIAAANDLESEDNETTIGHTVSVPYRDLAIEQSWHWGTLVPGGHMRLGLNFRNQGNLPAAGPARLTATLPAGTSFSGWESWGWASVSFVSATGNQAVWEVSGLDAGYHGTIELALDIDPGALPGAVLATVAAIAAQPGEIDLANNHSAWEEMLYANGPNLRLRKVGDWHGHGEGHNAWFRLEVENVGDQPVANVTIRDTYPAEMALDGEPGVGYHQWWTWTDHPGDHYFTVMLESLEPMWVVNIDFNMLIPGAAPLPFGLVFTNVATVNPVSGDRNPGDNEAAATLTTGPDLYVEKTLVAGEPLPGELVTYRLLFGNRQAGHAWWWNAQGNVYLIDTLPPGVSYVAATQRWCSPELAPWCEREPDLVIDEKNLIWNTGTTGGGNWNEILLTVRLPEDVTAPGRFTNWATVVSDRPRLDVEPFYDNNSSSYSLVVGHYVYLPLMSR